MPVLKLLTDGFRRYPNKDVEVYLGDATMLSTFLSKGVADVINVDPPYFEQVVYSDKLELFWVILRRSLWPVLDTLFSRDRIKINWSPKGVGGSEFPRERELVVRSKTRKELTDKDEQVVHFKGLFNELVEEFYEVLKDDGRLILWFTHPSDVAWRCVGESLYRSGFVVTKVYPMFTEMPTRYKKQVNLIAQQITLGIVAKKAPREPLKGIGEKVKESLMMNEVFVREAENLAEGAILMVKGTQLNTVDAFALTLGTAISVATKFELPFAAPFNEMYSAATAQVLSKFLGDVLVRILSKGGYLVREEGGGVITKDEANALVERIKDVMLRDSATRAYVPLFLASRVDIAAGRPYARISTEVPAYRLDFDFVQTTSKLCDFDLGKLMDHGLIAEEEVKGVGKYYVPTSLQAMLTATMKVPETKLLATLPGLAILATYTALKEHGTAEGRAKLVKMELERKLNRGLSATELADVAALGLLTLSLTPASEVKQMLKEKTAPFIELEAIRVRDIAASALKILAIRS